MQINVYLHTMYFIKNSSLTIFPVGRAAEEPEFCLTGEELKQVLDFIRTTRKEGIIRSSYGCEGFLGNYEGEVRNTPYSM